MTTLSEMKEKGKNKGKTWMQRLQEASSSDAIASLKHKEARVKRGPQKIQMGNGYSALDM
jgi:hypothetical protein